MARTARNTTQYQHGLVSPPSDDTEDVLKEGLQEKLPALSLEIDDLELARNIDTSIQNGATLHEDLKRVQDLNEDYYLGHQVRGSATPGSYGSLGSGQRRDKVRTVENRIFLSVETLIPDATARPPEPLVFTEPDDFELGRNLEKVLIGKYQEQMMKTTFRTVARQWALYRVGGAKLVHDTRTDDFKVVAPRPQRLVFDPRGISVQDCRYIGELVDEPLNDVIEKFPDKREEIMRYIDIQNNGLPVVSETPTSYWEFWTNNFVAWKLGTIILDKSKNPMWNWDNPRNNYLVEPVKPYHLMRGMFTLGKTVYDDTSLVEQNKTVQDGINKTHWAISDDLADRGTVVGSGDGITKEELKKYRGATGEKIYIGKGEPRKVIDRLEPKTIQAASLAYKQDLDVQSDNIMGTHGQLRGEREGTETFSGRALLKDQDTGRAAPIAEILEDMALSLYNNIVQYMKLYYDVDKFVPYVDEEGTAELMRFKGSDIKQGMKIQIRPGSTLPLDKFVQRNEALELANIGKIDDITLFERLGWPKPVESAKRILIYNLVISGQMSPDVLFPGFTQEVQKKLAEAAQTGSSMGQENPEIPPEITQDLANVNAQPGQEDFVPPANEIAAGLATSQGVSV